MSERSLSVFSSIADFLTAAEPLLVQDEAANGLPLGVALAIERNPHTYPEHLLTTLAQDGGVVIAGVQTGVRPLLLAVDQDGVSAETITYFARQLAQQRISLGGVHGPTAVAEQFAAAWSDYTGQPHHQEMALGVFDLKTVVPPRDVAGTLQQADYNDTPFIADWAHKFQLEALGISADMQTFAERSVHDGSIFKWVVDCKPVSIARWQRPLRNGVTISFVYTPLQLRGRGYASACVAALSQKMLDDGWQFCTLHTDAGNPTSNKIYQQIGYRKVSEHVQVVFTE